MSFNCNYYDIILKGEGEDMLKVVWNGKQNKNITMKTYSAQYFKVKGGRRISCFPNTDSKKKRNC